VGRLVFHQRLEREGCGLEGWVVRTWEVLVVILGWSVGWRSGCNCE
jgi:hypothetical protein